MIRFYDSLSRQKREFKPRDPELARIYVCGPTVYDYAHLGHARCYVIYDVLIRHLRKSGQAVTYVRNITDIDDKILKRAKENGESPRELSERFTDAFHEDMESLGNISPDIEPKVSDHLGEICDMVETLIDKGHAYEAEGDVYFSVESFETYGKLSGRDKSDNEAGASARLDDTQLSRKRKAADFALWKRAEEDDAEEGVTAWKSPWSVGRPGWHIECSAMATKHLGPTLDLHGGGLDLVFPHHENELAQAEGATGQTYCNHWVHNGFVEVNKTKMGKSLGNFFTVRDLFEHVEPEAIRLFTMTVHYRSPLNFDWALDDNNKVVGFPQLEEAERRLEYLYRSKARLLSIPEKRIVDAPEMVMEAVSTLDQRLSDALDDDLNMPSAIAELSDFLSAVNELADAAMRKKGKIARSQLDAALIGFDAVQTRLGLGRENADLVLLRIRDRRAKARGITPEWVESQIAARATARAERNYELGDTIRDGLTEKGIELHDSPDGTGWTIT